MTTQLEYARQGNLTKEMTITVKTEGLYTHFILDKIARGMEIFEKDIKDKR